ncbi:MAG: gas vesicle protein GvpN [Chloroflexi bacterium HGW-Chloroflexi-1]|nr:MAG: gas vesicle protein GvpN [Chloroflexi bacterium HGW-Chloroflexi-1]
MNNTHPTTSPQALRLQPAASFVETPFVRELTERALAYLAAGFPVHFRGPAGSGKTTMAMHVASQLDRPVMLMMGDDEFITSDLVGKEKGFRRRRVVDNYVHTVLKTEEDMTQHWVSNRLTLACQEGLTLVYDEFTRSRPEANNVLLSVLEEGLLVLPSMPSKSGYVRVNPGFSAIFTSNPEDYVGVHKSQDALLDRMITIDLEYFDRETEMAITRARAGLPAADAARIVDLVRGFRASGQYEIKPTVRKCLMIGKVMAVRHARASAADPIFRLICLDVLGSEPMFSDDPTVRSSQQRDLIEGLIEKTCPPEGLPAWEDVPPAGGNHTEMAALEDVRAVPELVAA